jgi:hypothetical protein
MSVCVLPGSLFRRGLRCEEFSQFFIPSTSLCAGVRRKMPSWKFSLVRRGGKAHQYCQRARLLDACELNLMGKSRTQERMLRGKMETLRTSEEEEETQTRGKVSTGQSQQRTERELSISISGSGSSKKHEKRGEGGERVAGVWYDMLEC